MRACHLVRGVLPLLILVHFPPAASEEISSSARLDTVLAGIESFRREVVDLSGDFRQVRRTRLLDGSVESTGKFFYRRPEQLHLNYAGPEESEVVVNKTDLWLYFPATRQAQHYDLTRQTGLSGFFVALGGSNADLRRDFEVSLAEEAHHGQKTVSGLVLRPRRGTALASDVSRLELLVESPTYRPRKVRIFTVNGDELELEFSRLAVNTGLDQALFEFKPPAGVAVVDFAEP